MMQRLAPGLMLALAGCSAARDALLPLPTPVQVRTATCAMPLGGCREDLPGLILEIGTSTCYSVVYARVLRGPVLRIDLKGMATLEDPPCVEGMPAQAGIPYGYAFPQTGPVPETVEIVYKGRLDRYRVASPDSLVPLATSFTTLRPHR